MNTRKFLLTFMAVLLALGLFTGCNSTGGGGVSVSGYYGMGFYDPWYYGGYYDQGDIIVTPPPPTNRPDRPGHPEQPIYQPPQARPTPPSIPSSPRPSARPSGRGGGGRR